MSADVRAADPFGSPATREPTSSPPQATITDDRKPLSLRPALVTHLAGPGTVDVTVCPAHEVTLGTGREVPGQAIAAARFTRRGRCSWPMRKNFFVRRRPRRPVDSSGVAEIIRRLAQ